MMNPHQIIQKYHKKNGRSSRKVILERRSSRENVKKQTRTRDVTRVITVKHLCDRCNYKAQSKKHLEKHIKAKHTVSPTLPSDISDYCKPAPCLRPLFFYIYTRTQSYQLSARNKWTYHLDSDRVSAPATDRS